MNEVSGMGRDDGLQVSQSVSDFSAGAALRQAREAAGISLEVLAASLKVTVDKLAALEADRWEALPDVVFARGLAASVCRSLSLDPAPVLQRLPQAGPRLAPQGERINAPFKEVRVGAGSGLKAYLSRPVGLAVLALLVAAGALLLLPTTQDSDPQGQAPAVVSEAPGREPVVASVVTTEVAGQAVPPAPMPVEPVPAPVPETGAAPTTAVTPPAVIATASPVAAAPAAAGTQVQGVTSPVVEGLLGFSASADSWVKVTDARGVVVLSRLVRAGESVNANGTVPLAVVVGRADATRVTVRGQAMDLAPIARDNVARFEVK